MACGPCERRRKAARKQAQQDYERAEALAAEGRLSTAKVLRARAKATRLGLKVFEVAGKALGIHGELEDGRQDSQPADPAG